MFIKLEDGTNIYYELYKGDYDKTLVFLHGNMEDSSYFIKQKEYFKCRYNLLFIDTRGHGKSEFGSGKYSLKLLASDLKEILEGLRLNNYFVIGFSDGANVGMEYVCSHDDSFIKGIVLIGGNLRPFGLKFRYWLGVRLMYIGSIFNRKRRNIIKLMLKKGSYSFADLSKVSVDALVLAGNNDMIREKETIKIADSLLNSEMKIINDANHFFIYEKSDLTNEIIEEFIRERGN